MSNQKESRRLKIKKRIRAKIDGTAIVPRLSVFRSNTSIYAQLIDDNKGVTLCSASSLDIVKGKNATIAISKEVGKALANRAKEQGIDKAVFDRNGYLYHGKIKALADGAREGGLQF
jgi:large subunit ribosomal protein L18